MGIKIAVDNDLANVRQALAEAGYELVNIEKNIESADVLVISGTSEDVVGFEDVRTDAAIINAAGMDAISVVDEVRERLARRQ
jgi:S-adenosylhomocysteine hydrolase